MRNNCTKIYENADPDRLEEIIETTCQDHGTGTDCLQSSIEKQQGCSLYLGFHPLNQIILFCLQLSSFLFSFRAQWGPYWAKVT